MTNLLKVKVASPITSTRDMLVNISNSVAAATAQYRVNFNSIENVELYVLLKPNSLEELLRIHSSLSYKGYKDNVKTYCLTKDGYVTLGQYVRKYIKVMGVKELPIECKYTLNKYGFMSIDYKALRFDINNVKSILCPVHTDSVWTWVREFDTLDGTFEGPCSEEESGSYQVETRFSYKYVVEDVSAKIVSNDKDTKFLVKYIKNKKLDFDVQVNGTPVPANKEIKVSLTEEQERVLQAEHYVFGDFDLECLSPLFNQLLLKQQLIYLDKFRYDELIFEGQMLVLIDYICKGYEDCKDRRYVYQDLLVDLMNKMEEKGYFLEPDLPLYEEEDEE